MNKKKIFKTLAGWILFTAFMLGIYFLFGATTITMQDAKIKNVQDTASIKKASKNRQMEQKTYNERLKKQLESIKKDTTNIN